MLDPKIQKIKNDRTRKIAYKPRKPRAKVSPRVDSCAPVPSQFVPVTLLVDADDDLPLSGVYEGPKGTDLPLEEANRAPEGSDLSPSAVIEAPKVPISLPLEAPVVTIKPAKINVIPHPKTKIDLAKALDLRYRHRLSVKEIAEYFGVVPSSVTARLHAYLKHLPNLQEVRALDSIRPDIIKGTLLKNLASLSDPAKLKRASLNNVAYSAGQLHNMLRLEEGKSTQNVFTADYFAYIKEQARQLPKENPNDINAEDE